MYSWIVQVGAALALLSILAIGIFTSIHSKPTSAPETETPLAGEPTKNSKTNDIFADTDNDGLKNWQEDLWKTDKNRADSDNDGTSDGAEVAQNRDPNKLPPDQITFTATSDLIKTPTSATNNKQQTTNNTNAKSEPSGNGSVETIVVTNSPLYDYGNTLALVLTNGRDANRSLEQSVFNDIATASGTPKAVDFDNLLKIAAHYMALSQNIAGISAPKEAQSINNELSIRYKNYAAEVEKLASYKSTLKIPISAFQTYNTASFAVGEKLYDTATFFKERGIRFKSADPGYIFTLPAE